MSKPDYDIRELRIGNWLMFNGHTKSQVYTLEIMADGQSMVNYLDSTNDDMYDAIPLTPKILEKAGFERIPELSETHWEYKLTTKSSVKIFYHCGTSSFIIGNPCASRTTIIYLHQLQNLYFALTGTELEINL